MKNLKEFIAEQQSNQPELISIYKAFDSDIRKQLSSKCYTYSMGTRWEDLCQYDKFASTLSSLNKDVKIKKISSDSSSSGTSGNVANSKNATKCTLKYKSKQIDVELYWSQVMGGHIKFDNVKVFDAMDTSAKVSEDFVKFITKIIK